MANRKSWRRVRTSSCRQDYTSYKRSTAVGGFPRNTSYLGSSAAYALLLFLDFKVSPDCFAVHFPDEICYKIVNIDNVSLSLQYRFLIP